MDNDNLPSTVFSANRNYGSAFDVLIEDIQITRKHSSGCSSDDGVLSTHGTECLECPYNPYRDSNDPCKDLYTIQGVSLIDNQLFSLPIPVESAINAEAIYRVLMALGGLSSRTVKISIKDFTTVDFYINKVIPHK